MVRGSRAASVLESAARSIRISRRFRSGAIRMNRLLLSLAICSCFAAPLFAQKFEASPNAADGLEQLEHVRRQHQRKLDPRNGRRDRRERHAGGRLRVYRARRLLERQGARCRRQSASRSRAIPQRHESARRLSARQRASSSASTTAPAPRTVPAIPAATGTKSRTRRCMPRGASTI